jgi:hypothetical protein
MNQITQLLQGIAQGDGDASAELLPLVYAELRRLAAHKMAHEAAGNTITGDLPGPGFMTGFGRKLKVGRM